MVQTLTIKLSVIKPNYSRIRERWTEKSGGRKCFRRETILDWLSLTDDDINSQLEQKGTKGYF
jgi:hypothetical protein